MPALLSVLLPVYNEEANLPLVLERINQVKLPLPIEVIIVDDGSTDHSAATINQFASSNIYDFNIKTAFHHRNQGKGAALRTALKLAEGDIIIIRDADLEYSPLDWPRLLDPLLKQEADVVYGSRFLDEKCPKPWLNRLANQFLTKLTNLVTRLRLTDMETCYKLFRRELLEGVRLKSARFGIEPEVTIKLARTGARFIEVPISYQARKFQEGKKINWKDGLAAVFHIIRFAFFD